MAADAPAAASQALIDEDRDTSPSASGPDGTSTLELSVVLSTRNRAASLVACVETILANCGFDELVVVDQSDDDATELALGAVADARLRYVRTATRGVTASRNLGTELTGGDVVLFTDDDCRVPSDWVAAMTRIFDADPDVAVVCGRVRVADEVQDLGFTESFQPVVRVWQGRFPPFGRDWGITANMAVRRPAFDAVGGFDPLLGAGSPLRSGGEPDLLYRLLRSGRKVVNAAEVVVDHYGVRAPGEASQRLIRGYGQGSGAALFKHVRRGDLQAVRLYARHVGGMARWVASSVSRTGRPTGLGFLLSFLWGSLRSFRFGVDRRTGRYVRRSWRRRSSGMMVEMSPAPAPGPVTNMHARVTTRVTSEG